MPASSPPTTPIVRVAIDVPLDQLFEYRADGLELSVGDRVLVPFGKRNIVGLVLGWSEQPSIPIDRLKRVTRVLPQPGLSADDLRLLRFAADYYHYPVGQVVMTALPQRFRRIARALRDQPHYRITAAGRLAQPAALLPRAPRKRRMLEHVQKKQVLTPEDITALGAGARKIIEAFILREWVERVDEPCVQEITTPPRLSQDSPPLTATQTAAVEAATAHIGHFRVLLLLGVTGSGKTEVYLRVCERVLAADRQILILVPEIALTPQLEAMVQSRFPDTTLARLHSGLNETERAQNWMAAQSGRARIILGTRLAVFTPLPALGFIVVDEEHDTSLKQTEGFCYSARDLAVVRARQRGVPVILGSATPALESYYNATRGRYTLLELPERINSRPPRIECVPLEESGRHSGIAPRLLEAIAENLRRQEQSLIFINRRGYAPVLMCHSCGWLSGCHRCSAQLVLHLAARQLHCHHCGHHTVMPEACPTCGDPALSPVGQGTQRIEEALRRHFPEARVLRIDRDTTRRKHAWGEMRANIRAREVDILVGTQVLAKGHDFPYLTLVGVLNADSQLYSADFRASERLYAQLTQVAGRAGRGEGQGQVLIQTAFPEHPLYRALRTQNLHDFARQLLAERAASGFPPYVHQALLRAEAAQLAIALDFLEHARAVGCALAAPVELYDAVPAAMVRLAGRERAQLLVQAGSRPALHAFLREWTMRLAPSKSNAARWALEVDPLDL